MVKKDQLSDDQSCSSKKTNIKAQNKKDSIAKKMLYHLEILIGSLLESKIKKSLRGKNKQK